MQFLEPIGRVEAGPASFQGWVHGFAIRQFCRMDKIQIQRTQVKRYWRSIQLVRLVEKLGRMIGEGCGKVFAKTHAASLNSELVQPEEEVSETLHVESDNIFVSPLAGVESSAYTLIPAEPNGS